MSTDEFNRHKAYAAKKGDNIKRWYKRMGHLNAEYLRQMPKIVEGMNLSSVKLPFCEPCAMNKAHRQHNKNPTCHQAKEFLEQIHMDFCDRDEIFSTAGNRYFCILTNDAICWKNVLLLKTKTEMKSKLSH